MSVETELLTIYFSKRKEKESSRKREREKKVFIRLVIGYLDSIRRWEIWHRWI